MLLTVVQPGDSEALGSHAAVWAQVQTVLPILPRQKLQPAQEPDPQSEEEAAGTCHKNS